MTTKVIANEEAIEMKKEREGDKANIHLRWLDNGQIMMEMRCYPDEIDALKELFDFIYELSEEP